MAAAEIGLNDRPAERAQVIAGGVGAVGVAEAMTLHRHGLGPGEGEKGLVRQAERQAGGGVALFGQVGRETNAPARQNRCRHGDDHPSFGGDRARLAVIRPMGEAPWSMVRTGQSNTGSTGPATAAMAAP